MERPPFGKQCPRASLEKLESRRLLDAVLNAPSNASAGAITTNSVQLNWTDTSTGEDGYRIERSSSATRYRLVGTTGPDASTFTDTTVASGTSYTYKIRAFQGTTFSPASAVSVTTKLGAPQDLHSNNDRLHLVRLQWSDVAGENSYIIQRSPDGTTWSTLATLPANSTVYEDQNLPQNTSFHYRITAINSIEQSAPSPNLVASTAAYRVLSGTTYAGQPNPPGPGVETAHITTYHNYFDWRDRLRKDYTFATAQTAASLNQVLIIDIENLFYDIRSVSTNTADQTIADFNQIVKWVHQAQPSVKVGFYGGLPVAAPAGNDPSALSAWQQADDYVLSRLDAGDYYFPSLYTAPGVEMSPWEANAERTLTEAQRFGKPVYPFIMMDYEFTAFTKLPQDYWQMELAVTRKFSDGAVLWGGETSAWDPNAVWWQQVQAQISEAPALPATPTGLTIDPQNATLHWDALPSNVDTLRVESSLDGTNFQVAGYVGRDQTQWSDPLLHSGVPGYYRIIAVNGFGESAPTTSVSATIYRNAFTQQEAESRDSALRDTRYSLGVSIGNGDWLGFNAMHFDTAPTQLLLKMDIPPANAGMDVQVRLDSLSGPIVGEHTLGYTNGWGDTSYQSIAISNVTGVHDVYLVFSGGTTTSAFDWLKFTSQAAPSAPLHLKAKSTGGAISLTWLDEAGDESGYRVDRSTDGGAFVPVANLAADSIAYIDTTVAPTSRYTYRIVATNIYGASAPTNSASGIGGTQNAYQKWEAEKGDEIAASSYGTGIAINSGNYVRLYAVDFGSAGAASAQFRVALPSTIQGRYLDIHIDDPNGAVVGSLRTIGTAKAYNYGPNGGPPPPTRAWTIFKTETAAMNGATGIHDVYIVGRGAGGICNLDWFQFVPNTTSPIVSAVTAPDPLTLTTVNDQVSQTSIL